jgi:hypothetical protein
MYYNGYRFTEEPLTLYNPFGLLNHFDKNGKFLPYWFTTGTPTFLTELIKQQKIDILDLNNLTFGYEQMQKFDIESLDAIMVLYQTGYLTIIDFDEETDKFTVDYPNLEVRSSFTQSLMELYLNVKASDSNSLMSRL